MGYRREQNGIFPSSIQEKDSLKFAVFSNPLLLASFSFDDPRSAVDEVPDKHHHPSDDRDIEVPEQSPDILPVRPERDARVREGKTERKRPQHGVKGESFYVHPDDAGGIGDYRADDRKQPTDEDGTFPCFTNHCSARSSSLLRMSTYLP